MTTTAQTLFIFTVFFLVAFLGKSISVADSVENNGELENVPIMEEEIRGEEDESERAKRTVINIFQTSDKNYEQWEKYLQGKYDHYLILQDETNSQDHWKNTHGSNRNEDEELNGQTNSGVIEEDLGQDEIQLQQLKEYEVRIREQEYKIEDYKKEYEKVKVDIERLNKKGVAKWEQKYYYKGLNMMKKYEQLIERELNAISKQRKKYEILKQLVYKKTQHSNFPQWENIIDSNENGGGQLNGQTNSKQSDIEDLPKHDRLQQQAKYLWRLQQLEIYELLISQEEYKIEHYKNEYEKLKAHNKRLKDQANDLQQQQEYYDTLRKMEEYKKQIAQELNKIRIQREHFELLKQEQEQYEKSYQKTITNTDKDYVINSSEEQRTWDFRPPVLKDIDVPPTEKNLRQCRIVCGQK